MFELEVAPKITKELLLSKYSQEEFFEFYLGVPVKRGLFCCPSIIRSDKNPTCAFYKNSKGVLKFKDFAGPQFDFVGCVMYLHNCSYYMALKIIANDFGFISSPKLLKNEAKIQYTGTILKETEKARIAVEIKDFSEKELEWWNSFGISAVTLKKYRVFSIKSIFLNGNYFNSSTDKSPVYGYYGGTNSDGDELWRLYMPTKRSYRFLSNWNSSMIQGARQLPKSGNHCIITKSMKDVMCLSEYGLNAIAPNSENILISEAAISKILSKFSEIIVFFDNDLAGVKSAHKYKKKYGFRCVFIRRSFSKDFSDLNKKVSRTVFYSIVDELTSIISDKSIRKTKHFYVF